MGTTRETTQLLVDALKLAARSLTRPSALAGMEKRPDTPVQIFLLGVFVIATTLLLSGIALDEASIQENLPIFARLLCLGLLEILLIAGPFHLLLKIKKVRAAFRVTAYPLAVVLIASTFIQSVSYWIVYLAELDALIPVATYLPAAWAFIAAPTALTKTHGLSLKTGISFYVLSKVLHGLIAWQLIVNSAPAGEIYWSYMLPKLEAKTRIMKCINSNQVMAVASHQPSSVFFANEIVVEKKVANREVLLKNSHPTPTEVRIVTQGMLDCLNELKFRRQKHKRQLKAAKMSAKALLEYATKVVSEEEPIVPPAAYRVLDMRRAQQHLREIALRELLAVTSTTAEPSTD